MALSKINLQAQQLKFEQNPIITDYMDSFPIQLFFSILFISA